MSFPLLGAPTEETAPLTSATLVLPLLLAFVLLWYLVHRERMRLGLASLSLRGSMLVAFVLFEMALAGISEASSFHRHFTRSGLALSWVALDVGLAVLAGRSSFLDRVRTIPRRVRAAFGTTSAAERVLASLAAAEAAVFVLMGAMYVPTNRDSLVYHLARVAHWVQNRSVYQFPTHYPAQIELSPLHEYNMAQLHVLTHTDRLDGFVQLFAVALCVVGASEIARLLGGSRHAQVLAAGLVATIPSVVLEATSTQNNDFAGAVATAFLTLLLVWARSNRCAPVAVLLAGAGSLAVLTKGTLVIVAITIAAPVIVLGVARQARTVGCARAITQSALALLIGAGVAFLVCGPFLIRNLYIYGALSGPTSRSTISYNLTPAAGAANVIRSTASNFQIGSGQGVEATISHLALSPLKFVYDHLNVDPTDWHYLIGKPSDAFASGNFSARQRDEDYGADPWQTLGIVVTLAVMGVRVMRGDRILRLPLIVGGGLSIGYILFTATARWSPYGVRYQIPLLVIWCSLIALLLARMRRWIGLAVVLSATVLTLPMLLYNNSRPIAHPMWSRGTGIFRYYQPWVNSESPSLADIAAGQTAIAKYLAGTSCRTLGEANWIMFEYPLWVALADAHWNGRIVDVDVADRSSILQDRSVRPCALIRQVPSGFISNDKGMVTVPFAGGFELSIDAAMAH